LKKITKYSKQELSQEISAIEKSERNNEHPNLSSFEKAIIYKYSDDGYELLNEQLRLTKGNNKTEFGILLELSLSKLPNFDGLVYRSAKLTPQELNKYNIALQSNKAIIEPTFISTSKSRAIAMEFKGNTLFRIYSRTGKIIEKIAKFGIYNPPNEKEVLFNPNCTFKVLEITKENDYPLITMEEI
jgi:hypothetical protein